MANVHRSLLLLLPTPNRGGKYCDESVCMSVCLLEYVKNDVFQTSQNFLYAYVLSVAPHSSEDSAICYVLPAL